MLLEIQKHINKAVEMVCKEDIQYLITVAYIPFGVEIIVHFAMWSILFLQIGKHTHFLWVSPMIQAHTFPHWLWGQFLMELNHLILISEAAGPVQRLWGKDLAPRIVRGRVVWWCRHSHLCLLRIPVLGKQYPWPRRPWGGCHRGWMGAAIEAPGYSIIDFIINLNRKTAALQCCVVPFNNVN